MGALHRGALELGAPRRRAGRPHAWCRSSSTRASSPRTRILAAIRATRPAISPSSAANAAIWCGRRPPPTCIRKDSPHASCRPAPRRAWKAISAHTSSAASPPCAPSCSARRRPTSPCSARRTTSSCASSGRWCAISTCRSTSSACRRRAKPTAWRCRRATPICRPPSAASRRRSTACCATLPARRSAVVSGSPPRAGQSAASGAAGARSGLAAAGA